jgi:hypothetical protein
MRYSYLRATTFLSLEIQIMSFLKRFVEELAGFVELGQFKDACIQNRSSDDIHNLS